MTRARRGAFAAPVAALLERLAACPGALMATLLVAAGLAPPAGAAPVSDPYRLSPHVAPGERHGGVRLLGTVSLRPERIDGLTLGGLSGLAWDADEALLYALSDAGAVFHLRPRFADGRLAGVEALAAYRLRDARGRALAGARGDAEALVVERADNGRAGDSVLVASFERVPRIARFAPDGRALGEVPLPARLRRVEAYASPNQGLEALALVPGRGLLTAPERPLAGGEDGVVRIVSVATGDDWSYRLAATPNASLVALEALPDGALLALERGHGLMFLPMIITLRRARIDFDAPGSAAEVRTLATLDTSEGFSVDNFEGLTRYRGLEFFMVSDDNFNALQKTLLTHFSLAEPGDGADERDARNMNPVKKQPIDMN